MITVKQIIFSAMIVILGFMVQISILAITKMNMIVNNNDSRCIESVAILNSSASAYACNSNQTMTIYNQNRYSDVIITCTKPKIDKDQSD